MLVGLGVGMMVVVTIGLLVTIGMIGIASAVNHDGNGGGEGIPGTVVKAVELPPLE
jgi:hypothetical protein